MTRLADRLLEGCQPFRPSLVDPEEWESITRAQISKDRGKPLSGDEFRRLLPSIRSHLQKTELVATTKFDPKDLSGAPIFAADGVGLYALSLPSGTVFSDVIASMAPPFGKFFIEFQGVSNNEKWGWG